MIGYQAIGYQATNSPWSSRTVVDHHQPSTITLTNHRITRTGALWGTAWASCRSPGLGDGARGRVAARHCRTGPSGVLEMPLVADGWPVMVGPMVGDGYGWLMDVNG